MRTQKDRSDAASRCFSQKPPFNAMTWLCSTFSGFVNLLFAIPLIRTLIAFFVGTGDIPDVVQPITPYPTAIDVGNGIAESATVEIPVGHYIVSDVGSPFRVGTRNLLPRFMSGLLGISITELSSILRDNIDGDDNDSDVEQILNEILTGASGAYFDCETEPGIDGVELVGLTRESYTLELTSLGTGQTDQLTFAGPGIAAVLAQFDTDADITDATNAISLVDLGSNETVIVGNILEDFIGPTFDGVTDAEILWNVALEGQDSRVTLLNSNTPDNFSVRIDNNQNGSFDYLVFSDSVTGRAFLFN